MAKRMKLWVAGAILLAIGGTVVASNMGFKFVPNLNQTGKIFTISLPLNQNYTDAESIRQDIDTSCGAGTFNKIVKINPSAGGSSQSTWLGFGGGNYLVNGTPANRQQGYEVQVNNNCVNWVLVGSHDPAFVYNFPNAGQFYLTTIPYHTTATRANDLFTSIPSINKIVKINVSAGASSQTTWLGFGGDAQNFTVKVGEAYIIQVNSANTTWTPAHF